MTFIAWVPWAATFASAVLATVLSAVGVRRPPVLRYGVVVTTAGAAVAIVGLVHRTIVSGHLPLFGTFENTYTATFFLLATAAAAGWRDWVGKDAWRFIAPWAIPLMLWGLRYRAMPTPVTISEQSVWVDVHVLFAWLAHSVLLWGGTLGLYRVFARRHGERPEPEDRLLFLLVSVGYVLLTIMICLGAWYLFVLFATFWRWEIVAACALATWIGYSLAIHGRLLHGLRGRGLDIYAAVMLVPVLLLFWIWSVYPSTYHFFDIALVRQ